ncbi:hypothetical protein GCM10027422_42430 [Hymenobacter arcticus]
MRRYLFRLVALVFTSEGLAQVQQQAAAGQPININPNFCELRRHGLRAEREARAYRPW